MRPSSKAGGKAVKTQRRKTSKRRNAIQAMLEKAVRICDANFGNLYLREGDAFRIGATYGASPAYVEFVRTEQLFHLNPKVGGLLVRTKELYHVADISCGPNARG